MTRGREVDMCNRWRSDLCHQCAGVSTLFGPYQVVRKCSPILARILTLLTMRLRTAELKVFSELTELDKRAEETTKGRLITTPALSFQRRYVISTVHYDAYDEDSCALLMLKPRRGPAKPIGYCPDIYN